MNYLGLMYAVVGLNVGFILGACFTAWARRDDNHFQRYSEGLDNLMNDIYASQKKPELKLVKR